MTRILGISGSLRSRSLNTALLRAAAVNAPDDVEFELYGGLESLPPFNEDHEQEPPAAVELLRELIGEADAVLIATPEYNTTMPGQLKHLVDWGSRPYGPDAALYGKPVAVIGASATAYGAIWAQDHLRKALGVAGARVTDAELPVGSATDKFDPSGMLTDPETITQLDEVVESLVAQHRSLVSV